MLARIPLYSNDIDYESIVEQIKKETISDYHTYYYIEIKAGKNNSIQGFDLYDSRDFEKPNSIHVKDVIKEIKQRLENPEPWDKTAKFKKGKAYVEISSRCIPTKPSIGPETSGFIVRSHSYMDPNEAVLNACIGLATKLVNKPDEIAIMTMHEDRRRGWSWPVSTGNSYNSKSQNYVQQYMDVLDIETGKIIEVPRSDKVGDIDFYDDMPMPSRMNKHLWNIGQVMEHFQNKLGVPIELEGSCTGDYFESNLNFFQLTKSYELPQMIAELTAVPEERLVFNKSSGAVGSIDFSGTVIYANSKATDEYIASILSRISPENPVLLLAPGFRDEVINGNGVKNYVRLSTEKEVLSDLGFRHKSGGFTVAHIFGYLTAQVYKRRREGANMCAVVDAHSFDDVSMKSLGYYSGRREAYHDKGITVLRGVKVEATKGKFQMYFV